MAAHKKQHALNASEDHSAGTDDTLLGTESGAVAEKSFGTAASADLIVQRDGSGEINVPQTPTADGKAASKGYVDSVVSGHRAPVKVLKIKDDTDQSGVDPTAGETGEAWVVNNWNTQSDVDIVEWDGAAWQTIVANSGSEPPDGTRVLVIDASAGGSFNGHENEIAVYDATGDSWSFTSPNDGDTVFIVGEGSVYENQEYIYDQSSTSWVSIGSSVPHNSTTGKQGGTSDEYYHLTQAQHDSVITLKANITLAGATPAAADMPNPTYSDGDKAIGVGTDGSIWMMYRVNSSTVKAVELT